MQRRYFISLAILIVVVGGVWSWDHFSNSLPKIPVPADARAQTGLPVVSVVLPDGTRMAAEVVSSHKQQQKGLMFRDVVPPLTGMLFVYSEPAYQQIWMKNVSVNLDVVFIGENKEITHIVENVQVPQPGMSDEEIPRVTGYGKYILEMKAGESGRLKLMKGLRLKFDR